jgi:hypothetical protein
VAVEIGRTEVVQIQVAGGVDNNGASGGVSGEIAHHRAVGNSNTALVQLVLFKKADINIAASHNNV